jgi:adenylosuccinate synthase
VEDASSSSMDVDTGLYPFTDSFHTTTGAVCTGLGVPEEAIETTIGVFSAVSIVRNAFLERIQDFPTHIRPEDPAYSSIRDRLEREYGVLANDFAFGWTDLNLIRHAELINKLSSMMLTHLDVLSNVETIKLATRYSLDTGTGEPQIFDRSLPAKLDDWELMVPEYIQMPGWK